MDCGSIISEPYNGSRSFATERSQSMSVLSPVQPRMTHLESLEAKMANIEVSLSSSTNVPRRRKGMSLGSDSGVPSPRTIPDSFDVARQKSTEDIIQNLRDQFIVATPLRSNAPKTCEIEAMERESRRLKNEADLKRSIIRNLKTALENLDITEQAELEYALGREELQLLSLMEESRTLQLRLEKIQKLDSTKKQTSLYSQIQSGVDMSLYAIHANLGRFGISCEDDGNGWMVDWVLDGEPLCRGDRIIEYNGRFVESKCKDIQKLVNSDGKCNLVVIRRKTSQQNHQTTLQSDNQRLQHRISYLEDQVKELQQSTKDFIIPSQKPNIKHVPNQSVSKAKGDHVTSISILPSNQHDNDKPQIFQRGNFVATIVDGKAIKTSSNVVSTAFTTTNSLKHSNKSGKSNVYPKSDSEHDNNTHSLRNGSHSQSHQQIGPNSTMFDSAPKISIRNFYNSSQPYLKHKEKSRENNRTRDKHDRHNSHPELFYESDVFPIQTIENTSINKKYNEQSNSGHTGNERYKRNSDIRAAKSLDFEEGLRIKTINNHKPHTTSILCRKSSQDVDYTSEPAASSTNTLRLRSTRPTPPKKPLRLSLQRTQSLQTIEANAAATIIDLERKRAVKRTHRGNKTPDLH